MSNPTGNHARIGDSAELRVVSLKAESDQETEPLLKAARLFELGAIYEHQHRDDATAVRNYLSAVNASAAFRPALFALIRIFERRRSLTNLPKLYATEAMSAKTPLARASARIDQAGLSSDALGLLTKASDELKESKGTAEAATAATLLERAARRAGEDDLVAIALSARIDATDGPTYRSLLLAELAEHHHRTDHHEEALSCLTTALKTGKSRWRVYETMERIARKREHLPALATALEGRAAIAASSVDEQQDDSGAFSTNRFLSPEDARHHAVALWFEASNVRLRDSDPESAANTLEHAIALAPQDSLLRLFAVHAHERAGNLQACAEHSQILLDRGATDQTASELYFRLAEHAQSEENVQGAIDALRSALRSNPDSIVARTVLDTLMQAAEDHETRLDVLQVRAQSAVARGDNHDSFYAHWRAAHVAKLHLQDTNRAKVSFAAAAQAAPTPEHRISVLRDHYGVSLSSGQFDSALALVDELCKETELSDSERAALLRERYELITALREPQDVAAALTEALSDPAAALSWAADAARVFGAESNNLTLLQKAHEVLADNSEDSNGKSAHFSGAARAAGRGGDAEQAEAFLRQALDANPANTYAVAMLEEILRTQGKSDEIVELLRHSADSQADDTDAEYALLSAAAAAEAAGDLPLAAETYQRAVEQHPDSYAPLFMLNRLAAETRDLSLRSETLARLAERETVIDARGQANLLYGEYSDLNSGQPKRAAEALRTALGSKADVPQRAALATLMLRADFVDTDMMEEALGLLSVHHPTESATETEDGSTQEGTEHQLLALHAIHSMGKPFKESSADGSIVELIARLRGAQDNTQRSAAWTALGQRTSDHKVAPGLLLQGLRTHQIATGGAGTDDAFMLAQDIAAVAPGSFEAAVAMDETLDGGDDPETRAEALGARLNFAMPNSAASLTGALGRSLTAAKRHKEAMVHLTALTQSDPDDLASWEALRLSARGTAQWDLVVKACDILAAKLTGPLKADLLEEAAAVLMDHLEDFEGAEDRLLAALKEDASRKISHQRLYDILAARDEAAPLLELVTSRIAIIDESTELEKLLYEQARLLRSLGRLEDASEALDNLLLFDENHVGGLALAVEIAVSQSRWDEAVTHLLALADADVPAKQRRISLLGAADFTEKYLKNPKRSLDILHRLSEENEADLKVQERIANIALRGGMIRDAAIALERATLHSSGGQKADFARRAGDARRHLSDIPKALDSYRTTLDLIPTDRHAAMHLVDIVANEGERREAARRFEDAVRLDLGRSGPNEADLVKLLDAVKWCGELDMQCAIADAIGALRETEEDTDLKREYAFGALNPLADSHWAILNRGLSPQLLELAKACGDVLAEADGLTVSAIGAKRGDAISDSKPHNIRSEVWGIANAFGVQKGSFYVRPNRSDFISVPEKRGTAWIIDERVSPPLTPANRFDVAFQSVGSALGTQSLINRTPTEAAVLLAAVARAVGSNLPLEGADDQSIALWTQTIKGCLSRKSKKAIQIALQGVSGEGLVDFCAAAKESARRSAMLVCGDIEHTLQRVSNQRKLTWDVVAAPEVKSLLEFWVTRDASVIRKQLGTQQTEYRSVGLSSAP